MRIFDATEREFIFDHGWRVADDGKLIISKEQFRKYQYTGKSVRDGKTKTMMIPSNNGCCLIFEGKHFCII